MRVDGEGRGGIRLAQQVESDFCLRGSSLSQSLRGKSFATPARTLRKCDLKL